MNSTKTFICNENDWTIEIHRHYDSCIEIPKIYGVVITPEGISIGWQKENGQYFWEKGKSCILDRLSRSMNEILSLLRKIFSSSAMELDLKWTDKAISHTLQR